MVGRGVRNSGWFWQSALVVLPVVALSGISLYYLRQDRASVEQEARERARSLAPELARRVGEKAGVAIQALAPPSRLRGAIVNGRITSPPDYPSLPSPPDWPGRLTPAQSQLWVKAQQAFFQRQEAAARAAVSEFQASRPPHEALANAQYELLLLESAAGASPNFVQRCLELARRSECIQAESGAPLSDLALLLALRHSRPDAEGVTEALASQVRDHPSFLTPELLDAAGSAPAIRGAWEQQEKTLALLKTYLEKPGPAGSGETWVERGPERFLALRTPQDAGWRVDLVSQPALEKLLGDALAPGQLPPWEAASLEIAGRSVRAGSRPRRGDGAILASAPGVLKANAPLPFQFSLEVADPEALFAGYRRRLWLTAGLILSAAATALLGLAVLRQNFRRQARLGEMKSNFVSSVSHELRAPIAAVRLMAESLDRGTVAGEKQKDYFRLIVEECRRLSALVENVLDFSRIDQGRKQYSFEPVDAPTLARHAVALMEPCAAERRVALSFAEPQPGAIQLEPCWDAQAVEQSLVNLLDNAIKHSPPGAEVTVGIEMADGAGAPEMLRLWVEDHGEGIPKEDHARIFDLFYRRGSELRRETKGAGIGLSIVRHVAEAHGGRVAVRSAVGEGSRFALELPVSCGKPPGLPIEKGQNKPL